LRREAEDLRRRLNEMNRQQQASSQQQQAGNSSKQGQSGSSSGSQGQRSNSSEQRSQLEQALKSVNEALDNMRAANQPNEGESSKGSQSAQEAGKNLRQALRQIDKPEASRLDQALEQFADRTGEMLDDQRRVESELYKSLSQGGTDSAFRRGGTLSQKNVKELVESKQRMAEDLSTLQGDMRSAVHEHRGKTPQTTKRLSEIVRDIEGSDVMYRLNRSAAEIYYGRAREAAPREGLITDALETLEHDLREAATRASTERTQKRESATADDLLAEVAELRRAVRNAQRAGSEQGAGNEQLAQQGEQQSENGRPGEQGDSRNGQGERPGEKGNAQASNQGQQGGQQGQQGGDNSQGQQADGSNGAPGSSQGGSSQRQGSRGGGAGAQNGLSAWNPIIPARGLNTLEEGRGSLARETTAISQRIRDLTNRMTGGELTPAELDALRRQANQLRRLNGDPMAEQGEAMLKVIDQIELTALNAAARAKGDIPAHATLPSPDSPRYREAVAEYYRRLGNR
jgi:hypothetical protein